MHDARNVANRFIKLADQDGEQLTPLQIQKLVYFAHAWMLGIHQKELIWQPVEAWKLGPVVPAIYHALSHYKSDPVDKPLPIHKEDILPFNEKEDYIIGSVYEQYGKLSGIKLSNLTHTKGSPWSSTKNHHLPIIKNDLIANHYAKLIKDRRGE